MKSMLSAALLIMLIIAFSACEHNVSMETTVHDDGKIDKTIVVETADTTQNFLGIGPGNGWKLTTDRIIDSTKDTKEKKWKAKFEKSFPSATDATNELAQPSDTLFRVSSKFEKEFKWFYTYLYFSDTYHTINRMKYPMDDYIAPEDFAFIDRLPAEGKRISKADSLYLSRLQEKIFDIYGLRAVYEVYYMINEQLIRESNLEERWIDTLKRHKESLFHKLEGNKNATDDFVFQAMDSLGIPLAYDKIRSRFDELYEQKDVVTKFINHASSGKYTHVINMPWNVVDTNADSVSGNRLLWNPPSIKFLLTDYTMYAEARRINYWAIALSGLVIIFAVYLFARKK